MPTSDQVLQWLGDARRHPEDVAMQTETGETYRVLERARLELNCTEHEMFQLGQQLIARGFIQSIAEDNALEIRVPVRITPAGYLHLSTLVPQQQVAQITRAADGQYFYGTNPIRLTPTPLGFFELAFNAAGAFVLLENLALDSERAAFREIREALAAAGAPENLWEVRRRRRTSPTAYRLHIRATSP